MDEGIQLVIVGEWAKLVNEATCSERKKNKLIFASKRCSFWDFSIKKPLFFLIKKRYWQVMRVNHVWAKKKNRLTSLVMLLYQQFTTKFTNFRAPRKKEMKIKITASTMQHVLLSWSWQLNYHRTRRPYTKKCPSTPGPGVGCWIDYWGRFDIGHAW